MELYFSKPQKRVHLNCLNSITANLIRREITFENIIYKGFKISEMLFAEFFKFSVSNKNVLPCCYNPISSLFNLSACSSGVLGEQKFKLLQSQHTVMPGPWSPTACVQFQLCFFFPVRLPQRSAFNSVNFSLLFVKWMYILHIHRIMYITYITNTYISAMYIYLGD